MVVLVFFFFTSWFLSMDHPPPNPVPSPGIIHHTKLGKPTLRWDPMVFEQVFLAASPAEGR